MEFLIDVDEVLAPFTDKLVPIVSGVLGRPWNPRSELPENEWNLFSTLLPGQATAVHAVIERPGFCAEMDVAPGSQQFIEDLRSLGCEVFALTSPLNGPFWVHERAAWLAKYFEIPKSHVVQASAKYKVDGDFFLDDSPDHVLRWAAKWGDHGTPMLWTSDFNRDRLKGPGDRYRVDGWEAVLEKVRRVKEERTKSDDPKAS